jgi:HPr kinase/phosphorylase
LSDISRPGLQFAGYYDYFDCNRIQLLGMNEINYLTELTDEERAHRLDVFFSKKPIAVIIARSLKISDVVREKAEKYAVPLLHTESETSSFSAALISYLKVQLAPRITRHGVLVEVYGEGVLMLGESGAGKSETAIELIKRGHRLIADDAVEIRRVSDKTLVGTAPENIRHFIELRGIGIINARRIFGIGSVKMTEKIDLVINLENWDSNKVYDRMGLVNETTSILDLDVPSVTIPVKPGRNLAVIIEVAAMNNRQKRMGYNSAQELLNRLGMDSGIPVTDEERNIWSSF